MKQPHHLTVGDKPFCDKLGCLAGLDVAKRSGVHTCDQPSKKAALEAAKKLKPFFRVPVRVVAGPCKA